MNDQSILLGIILLLLVVILFFVYRLSTQSSQNDLPEVEIKIQNLLKEINRIESVVKNEMITNRAETGEGARESRKELSYNMKYFSEQISNALKDMSISQKVQFEDFSNNLTVLTKTLEQKLSHASNSQLTNSKESRTELKETLESFKNSFSKSVEDFNKFQREHFLDLLKKQTEQNLHTSGKLDLMRETIEKKVSDLQQGNEQKLEEMRKTVDEKLQKTLETRLGESFKLVSERLEAVHIGLGDMRQLASGVGDLKRVLSNVKTRGMIGEYQLENILEQILTPAQYCKNIKTKQGSNAMVEFAIKLPGKDIEKSSILLPIDSKFPKEDFELLMDAYDQVAADKIEEYRKSFARGIKKCAYEICSKYIDPPHTTDFAILFLPFESLYAEMLRIPGLFESIQKECKIIITGPATLSALLNSLQMGFRTLAIEKRSSEVWKLLGAVKTEFGNFGGILDRTQKKLQEASNVIEQAGIRSRAIEKKLKNVEELPKDKSAGILENSDDSLDLPEFP